MQTVPPDILEKMHLVIDGSASDWQHESLMEYLRSHPEADAMFHRLSNLTIKLVAMEEVPEPADLKQNVMRQLPAMKETPTMKVFRPRWKFERAAVVRFAFVFAAGILAGVIFSQIFSWYPQMPASLVSGVFSASPEFSVGTVTDFDTVNVRGAFGVVRTRREGENVYVEANIIASEKTKLTFEYEAADLSYSGFQAGQDKHSSLSVDPGKIIFYTEEYGTYLLTFKDTGAHESEMGVTVCHEETCLYHTDLALVSESVASGK